MRSRYWVVAMLAAGSLLVPGCKKNTGGGGTGTGTAAGGTGTAKAGPGTGTTAAPSGPNALPADTAYASGNTKGVAMTIKIEVKAEGMKGGPKGGGDKVAQAQAASAFTQTLHVDDKRGRLLFQTDGVMVPVNTELRYDPSKKKYVLTHPKSKKYWVKTGAQLGNLFEGGPGMKRSGYKIKVKETKDKATVAGVEAVRSNATINFDYTVKIKGAEKKGSITLKLAIWHSADKKFKPAWGDMVIDFLSFPFQDAEGQNVIDTLKKKINFPVKWAMEVINKSSDKGTQGSKAPTFLTTATSVEVKDLPKADLAYPPAGYAPAMRPYSFGKGGQTIGEDVLGAVKPKKGKPPKKYDKGPGDKSGKKKGG